MGLIDDVKYLKDKFEEEENKKDKKTKKWRYPFGKKVGKAQRKKNYVTILRLNENSKAKFLKVRIDEQTFIDEGVPRLAAAGHVFQEGRKNNPLIILPSWSVEPFSAMDSFKQSLEDGTNIVGFQLLMNKMKLEAMGAKKAMGGMLKWVAGAVVIGIIAYAFITGGGA